MVTKKITEKRDLDAFLSRLSRIEGQSPTAVRDSERPDFIVTFGRGTVGIEITRTLYQECARVLRMHASNHPHQWVNLTHLVDAGHRRTNSELGRSIGPTALLQRWKPVAESMLDWKRKVAIALNSKRQKLAGSGYQFFTENWLLIHDFPPLSVDWQTRELAFQHLADVFSQSPTPVRDFDKIFIHSGDWLFRWCQGILEFN